MSIYVRNRQKRRRVELRRLRALSQKLLRDLLHREHFELGIYLVAEQEMRRLNETFLRHAGSTDVITFDYGEPEQPTRVAGEIFICIDEAMIQARRFRTTWQSELVRYLVHGVLHLCGYDDQSASDRRKMKREEDRLVTELRRAGYSAN